MNMQMRENHKMVPNISFMKTAENLKPKLHTSCVSPAGLVKMEKNRTAMHGWEVKQAGPLADLLERELGKGDWFIADFGDHYVGYLSLYIRPAGSPPDAPLKIKLTIGEMPVELAEPFDEYNGWLSSSWLQEETVFIDVLPGKIELPRRYSFRYVKVEVLDTSPKYKVIMENITCRTVTSADWTAVKRLQHDDPLLQRIDEVSVKTLADCMQDVFEDGPKRDRRLWLGDLRLQALASYETFGADDLAKRCLYLFAGVPDETGQVAANVFVKPALIADDTMLFDYSLFFISTLSDYFLATKDRRTVEELWPTALRQAELALERVDERGIVADSETWWSFIDWEQELNKQAPSQAVLIYALKQTIQLADAVGAPEKSRLEAQLGRVKAAAKQYLWDRDQQFFVSGADRQVSWASQVWMVLAGVLDSEKNKALMNRLLEEKPAVRMATPYMYHHFIEALLLTGETEEAVKQIKAYWGGMIEDGADTFWELYNPEDKNFSPYGSHLINSYCHAWSCTPAYLIRKYKV